jgi:hypothetical protein
VVNCGRPRKPGVYWRCAEHVRANRRDYYLRWKHKKFGFGPRERPFHELCIAVALEAAYTSGYRHGAVALSDHHRRARAAEAQ